MNLIFWVLGALAAGLMLAMQTGRPQVAPVIYLVWGAWLYILVTVGAVALEGMRLRTNITKNLQSPLYMTYPEINLSWV